MNKNSLIEATIHWEIDLFSYSFTTELKMSSHLLCAKLTEFGNRM